MTTLRSASAFLVALSVAGLVSVRAHNQQQPIQIPQPGVPQIMTLEGKFVRAAYNKEGYVILGYQIANRTIGHDWIMLDVGLTLMEKEPDYRLKREALSLDTPDGTLPLSITGDLDVNRLTVDEAEDLIRARGAKYLRDPVVTVTVVESGARAYIGGEVENPGFVSLAKPMSAVQAVLERGGFGRGADMTKVTIISHVEGKSVVRELNLRRDDKEGVPIEESLNPDDVVFVPKTGIAAANAWVEQWIDGLTPQMFKSVRFPSL